MKRRVWIVALVALLTTAPLAAEPPSAADAVFSHPVSARTLLATALARPAQMLSKAQVLRGSFTHRRYLSEMPQPLTASGEFVFARNFGVHWRTLKPFDSVFLLTDAGLVQRDEGNETFRLSAQEQPAVRMLASVFLALFTLDVESLATNFNLYAVTQGERWLVGLEPKSAAVANVFQRATLSGATNVERVVLTDPRGDRTIIELHEVIVSGEPPSAAIRALFAP